MGGVKLTVLIGFAWTVCGHAARELGDEGIVGANASRIGAAVGARSGREARVLDDVVSKDRDSE